MMPPTALIETLEALLAPGKRARLSPFVEAAQYRVLFGQAPDATRHAESCREILQREESRHAIATAALAWDQFTQHGKNFAANDYIDSGFLQAYLAYYFSLNVPKVQKVLLDLVRDGQLAGSLIVQDIGVGTGTTAIAVLDFLLAWGQICALYNCPFPVSDVQFMGIDRSRGSLDYAAHVVAAYSEVLQKRADALPPSGQTVLHQVVDWSQTAIWQQHDITSGPPVLERKPTLVVLSNVLNELPDSGRRAVDDYLHTLDEGTIVIVIEPGRRAEAKALMRWRLSLVTRQQEFIALAPCGQELGAELSPACDLCWNARREAFHQTSLYRACREAFIYLPEKSWRRYDEFENRLLSWSYTVVQRVVRVPSGSSEPLRKLSDGAAIDEPLLLRYIGTYLGQEPLGQHPDDRSLIPQYHEWVKFCPAAFDVDDLVLETRAGVPLPALHHGQPFQVWPIQVARQGIFPHRQAVLRMRATPRFGPLRPSAAPTPLAFLPDYSASVRQTVDELAYRLFGFVALHPFQHTIIGRALTGRSTLGIAATGAGKSECFILPAMVLSGVTIVVSPLRSLMVDQYEQRIKNRFGLDHLATYINGDVPLSERHARLKRMELGYYKLVYVTPEQLERSWILDSLQRTDQSVGVRYLVLDEVHCISQWGHDFRPAYLNICRRLRDRGMEPLRIALTATASPLVRADICADLNLKQDTVEAGGDICVDSSNRPELNLIVRLTPDTASKTAAIVADLNILLNSKSQVPDGKPEADHAAALVFMPWTAGNPDHVDLSGAPLEAGRFSPGVSLFAAYLERTLQRRVAIYHSKMDSDDLPDTMIDEDDNHALGDMSGRTRQSEQALFMKGQRDVMVATTGFGMGIDKSNIRLVIHRTLPPNLEAYAQEAGRAGRDGNPAQAILYYSPDQPPADGPHSSLKPGLSDDDIQTLFLRHHVIRTEDVLVLRAFLHSQLEGPARIAGNNLHVTNDQAIEFFEACHNTPALAGLSQPFEWPMVAPRRRHGYESADHALLLDRGHAYVQHSEHLHALLQALCYTRPPIGGHERYAFLEGISRVNCLLHRPRVLDAEAILASPLYFGERLRQASITTESFAQVIAAGDLRVLAPLLGMSLRDTVALIHDIAAASGSFGPSGQWRPALLGFSFMSAPLLGPATGRTSLAAWRTYAGAMQRASKSTAYERARFHAVRSDDGPSSDLDNWFGWPELPRSVSWDVQLGPAFFDHAHLPDFLTAFVSQYQARHLATWTSYRHLLTDYIGADSDGTLPNPRETAPRRPCLRAVLLGYLKSNEVIAGPSCLSCNRCVPDEHFVASMEERRAVVVRLSQHVTDILDELTVYQNALPPFLSLESLIAAAQVEMARQRSIADYLAGWSARLLEDTPNHRAALWVRIMAISRGVLTMRWLEWATALTTLSQSATGDEARLLLTMVRQFPNSSAPQPELIYEVEATLCQSLQLPTDEEAAWSRLLGLLPATTPSALRERAYTRLSSLYAPDNPLASPQRYADSLLQLAQVSKDPAVILACYKTVAHDWLWLDLLAHLETLPAPRRYSTGLTVAALCGWISAGSPGAGGDKRRKQVARYLANDQQRWLLDGATAQEARLLIEHIGTFAIIRHPGLTRLLLRRSHS